MAEVGERHPSNPSLGCAHRPPVSGAERGRLRVVLVLTASVMVVEVIGGRIANALALLADAGHMATDVAAVGLALFAAWIAGRPATPAKTYGYLRVEILAALINGTALFLLVGWIVWDAIGRLAEPPVVDPVLLSGVAGVGLAANIVALRILHGGRRHSLNLRAAYLHVLGDLLGSLGAVGAGLVIMGTGWTLIDPLISIGIAALIVVAAWRLVRESVDVLLEATPKHIALADVEACLRGIPEVRDVHDLHVWALTTGVVAMSGHAVVRDLRSGQRVLDAARGALDALGIHHVTLQVEEEGRDRHGG